jgi:TPR repeat protein
LQSNAAWLFEKGAASECLGPTGKRCTDHERYARAHKLWRLASEQGNVQAALLIGDAYYYGRGTNKDLERAAEAYWRAAQQRSAQVSLCFLSSIIKIVLLLGFGESVISRFAWRRLLKVCSAEKAVLRFSEGDEMTLERALDTYRRAAQ